MKPSHRIEREFGVPVPGLILDPEHWTRAAALKRLPDGLLDWPTLFGRTAPVVLDLGCGNGRFLLGSALARPHVDHVGIDILPLVLRYATRRANQRGLTNLRFAACDGLSFLRRHVSPGSLHEIHCYHPQPFHDIRHAGKRLWTPEFLALVHLSLQSAGKLFLQSDNAPYWRYLQTIVPAFFAFHEQPGPWPDSPRGRTRREIIALRRKLPIFRGWAQARTDIDNIDRLLESLPPPTFDAGPGSDENE